MLALGTDHAGWLLEEEIKAWLLERNAELLDFGTHDYPLEPALLMKDDRRAVRAAPEPAPCRPARE